jgi:hypothetical protein
MTAQLRTISCSGVNVRHSSALYQSASGAERSLNIAFTCTATTVETTAAPVTDAAVTSVIHEKLPAKQMLPGLYTVDTGYPDAELFVTLSASTAWNC